MKKFKCALCGYCCKASPISLLPHEEVVLRLLADKLKKPYKSRPGYRVFDSRRKVWIALSYIMELVDGKCQFLEKDRCSINYIYKPLICRSYPYVPRQVQYTLASSYRVIFATSDYGLSIKCPIIKKDKEHIQSLMMRTLFWPQFYMPREYKAALEMEEKRTLLLKLLTGLWQRGITELSECGPDSAPTINLYDILRNYYPNLPYILEIDKVLSKIGGNAY